MANKYLSHNNLPLGLVLLMCVLFLYKYLEVNSQDSFPIFVDNSEDYLTIDTFKTETRSVSELKELIKRHNQDPKIMNNILPNSIMRKYLAVVVVQVRSNIILFKNLIQSLEEAMGIKNTLLIFSHETFDNHINELVKNITFTKYIQIFYPHSIQLHRKLFPGDDSKFCVNVSNCEINNGRRNATKAQRKHHWWWTVNYVFDHLKPIEQHNGTIIFLEDDHYVAKDFIYILNMLEYSQKIYCPQCTILSLAVLKPNITSYQKPAIIKIKNLGSTQELMGIGFNKTVWSDIKNTSDYFCTFNDVDWARSFVYLLMKSPNRPYSMLAINGPRVFRFNTCQTHNYGNSEQVEMKSVLMSKIKNELFPKHGFVQSTKRYKTLSNNTGHGGWNDERDHILCKQITRGTTQE